MISRRRSSHIAFTIANKGLILKRVLFWDKFGLSALYAWTDGTERGGVAA